MYANPLLLRKPLYSMGSKSKTSEMINTNPLQATIFILDIDVLLYASCINANKNISNFVTFIDFVMGKIKDYGMTSFLYFRNNKYNKSEYISSPIWFCVFLYNKIMVGFSCSWAVNIKTAGCVFCARNVRNVIADFGMLL